MSALIASHAACLSSSGAGKSGKPCDRLSAPCNCAWRVISRMTDSVNLAAFWEMNCFINRKAKGKNQNTAATAPMVSHFAFDLCHLILSSVELADYALSVAV